MSTDIINEVPLEAFLAVSATLFAIGVYGVLARRNAVMILMAVELMLNAVNINLVAFAAYLTPKAGFENYGIVFAVFIITVAAAEVALALAIIIRLFRAHGSPNIDQVNLMKW